MLHNPICLFLIFLVTGLQSTAILADDKSQSDKPQADKLQWGSLRGRFLYAGEAPRREKLELNKDVEFCAPHKLISEELVVDPKTRGLKDVIIWLDRKKSAHELTIHPDFAKTASKKIRFDNLNCRFEPHVCVMRTSQTLVVGNRDAIAHSVSGFMFRNDPFNLTVPVNKTIEKTFTESETLPSKMACPIHAWMRGWLVVKDHPYVAVTDAQGKFEIPKLPAGEWTFRVWHESAGYIQTVSINNQAHEWKLGRFPQKISTGINDLGTLEVSPKLFTE